MFKQPFHLISGESLGVNHSSFSKIGKLNEGESVGQAEQNIFLNAKTGNLFLQGYTEEIKVPGFDFVLLQTESDKSNF